MLMKKIILRISLLERKVEDQFTELNESKINRLDRELQGNNYNNDFEPIQEIDEEYDDINRKNNLNNNSNKIDNNEFKQGMNMVSELNDNVLKL